MRLVTKGLLLLLVPSLAQLGLIVGFNLVHRETEFYPKRAQQDAEKFDGFVRYFLDDFSTVLEVQDAFVRKVPLSPAAADYLNRMKRDEKELLNFYSTFYERRRDSLALPEPDHLREVKKDAARMPAWFDAVSGPTQSAYDLARQREVRSDPALMQQEGRALQAALIHLGNTAGMNYDESTDPQRSLQQRDWFRTLIAFGSIVDLLSILVGCLLFSRNISKRLTLLLANVEQFKNGDEPTGIVSGDDEIARIDRTFKSLFRDLKETMFPHKAMMEHSQDLICLLDSYGRMVSTSNSCIPLLGYSPVELNGILFTDLVTDEMQSITAEMLKRAVAGQTVNPFESRFLRDDKSTVDVLISLTWSARDQSLFCVAHDITQRKAAEQLQQDVMHMVSHDLKTPLNAISNFHELLENGVYGELQPKNLEQVKRAQRSTERMLTLIKDLLDIERMKSGMLELDVQIFDLDQAIEQAKESIEALAGTRGIAIQSPPSDLKITGDRGRVIQVIVNLLSNAIKFSQPQGTVVVSASRDQSGVVVSVIDNGRGIPLEQQSTIFDRFSQVRSSDGTVHGGSGLGLAICRALVELHGGEIFVNSEVGKGSTFSFRIPDSTRRR